MPDADRYSSTDAPLVDAIVQLSGASRDLVRRWLAGGPELRALPRLVAAAPLLAFDERALLVYVFDGARPPQRDVVVVDRTTLRCLGYGAWGVRFVPVGPWKMRYARDVGAALGSPVVTLHTRRPRAPFSCLRRDDGSHGQSARSAGSGENQPPARPASPGDDASARNTSSPETDRRSTT
jgi:hypothetical protein